jgi:hypothetical protein
MIKLKYACNFKREKSGNDDSNRNQKLIKKILHITLADIVTVHIGTCWQPYGVNFVISLDDFY